MGILGNKWTALILRDLAAGACRFSELERSLESISPRTLSQRLDDLLEYGVIATSTCQASPSRCEYSLTAKGHDLLPILKQMALWGAKYKDC